MTALDGLRRQLLRRFSPDAIRWIDDVAWEGPRRVRLDEIDLSDEPRWEATKSRARILYFARKVADGESRPIVLLRLPSSPLLRIVDGRHRLLAHRMLGAWPIAYVGDAPSDGGPWEHMDERQIRRVVDLDGPIERVAVKLKSKSTGANLRGARAKEVEMEDESLYERLGGIFVIAAVVDRFSDALVSNPVVGRDSKNEALRRWHRESLDRLPGLKFMRTLWVADVAGGPLRFLATRPGKRRLGLEEAHRPLRISPEEFDEVAAELARTLDHFKVPAREREEVLKAFAAHKGEVIVGSKQGA